MTDLPETLHGPMDTRLDSFKVKIPDLDQSMIFGVDTDGKQATFGLGENRLYYVDGQSSRPDVLDTDEFALALLLASYPDIPLMTHQPQIILESRVPGFKTRKAFSDILRNVHPDAGKHFGQIGSGKGAWYYFAKNNQDVTKVCENARTIIKTTDQNGERSVVKRTKAIDTFEYYFNNPEEFRKDQKRKKIAGGAAIALAIGSASAIAFSRRNK